MEYDDVAASISPQAFFEQLVPGLLRASAPSRERRGTCQIVLFGKQRRAWTIDLGLGTVEQQPAGEPDLYLEMSGADFEAMLHDRLDWDAAIAAGRIRCDGELKVLARFAALLSPDRAAL